MYGEKYSAATKLFTRCSEIRSEHGNIMAVICKLVSDFPPRPNKGKNKDDLLDS